MSHEIDRRHFLKSIAAGGTVALTSWTVPGALTTEGTLARGCKVFTAPQAALVEAIAEQIVPTDDFPGGKGAGVVFYIDGVLAGPFGKFYRDHYERGLRMVDEVSQKQLGSKFASLTTAQQITFLKDLESGQAAGNTGRQFFALILEHTMEGYYGDPEHGGNRDGASWKMIGFEG